MTGQPFQRYSGSLMIFLLINESCMLLCAGKLMNYLTISLKWKGDP